MKKNLFINNNSYSFLNLNSIKSIKKSLDLKLKEIKKKRESFDSIFLVTEKIVKENGKIIREIGNIKILYSDNFTYILKQLSTQGNVTSRSIILSNSEWELYLIKYLKVYKNASKGLTRISFEEIEKKYNIKKEQISFLNDFIFLQEKNKEYSLGEKKTKELFEKYKDIKGIVEHLDEIENERTLEIIKFQRKKIEYYLVIKNLFLKEEDIIYEKK